MLRSTKDSTLYDPKLMLKKPAVGAFTDVVTATIPFFIIRNLHMQRRKQVLICVLMSLGYVYVFAIDPTTIQYTINISLY